MKPWISLSGDDDGKHYVLTPVSEARDNFEYDLHLIIESGKTNIDQNTAENVYIFSIYNFVLFLSLMKVAQPQAQWQLSTWMAMGTQKSSQPLIPREESTSTPMHLDRWGQLFKQNRFRVHIVLKI